ncbi:MAG: phosphatase PAP2 family protein [Prevotellaceae bacterium]|nr:phosphatase PAP2 family protein [Prevotellaceae bacterium]
MKIKYKDFYPIEIISFIYIALTTLFIVVFWSDVKENAATALLFARLAFVTIMVELFVWNRHSDKQTITVLRNVVPLAFVVHFYPETYFLNMVAFPDYLDPEIIRLDRWLFGCHPSTLFCEAAPWAWFNELMNFAYFSYFFVIAGIVINLLWYNRAGAYRTAFILLCSFFIYYTLFIIFPTAGPQFYVFDHDTALPVLGPMRKILLFFHSIGEQPTGAVPSSHVGIMVIYMILLWQHGRKLFWWILPLSVLLVLATVYIRAHYAVDVLLGFISAPPIYLLSHWCWRKLSTKREALREVR